MRPGCEQIAQSTSYLYRISHDLLESLKRLQPPPEGVLSELQHALARKNEKYSAITEEERGTLGHTLSKVIDRLPKGDLDLLPGHERFDRFKPSIDEADKLLSQAEELMFSKVVDCECGFRRQEAEAEVKRW
jgi:hypothetical protein